MVIRLSEELLKAVSISSLQAVSRQTLYMFWRLTGWNMYAAWQTRLRKHFPQPHHFVGFFGSLHGSPNIEILETALSYVIY